MAVFPHDKKPSAEKAASPVGEAAGRTLPAGEAVGAPGTAAVNTAAVAASDSPFVEEPERTLGAAKKVIVAVIAAVLLAACVAGVGAAAGWFDAPEGPESASPVEDVDAVHSNDKGDEVDDSTSSDDAAGSEDGAADAAADGANTDAAQPAGNEAPDDSSAGGAAASGGSDSGAGGSDSGGAAAGDSAAAPEPEPEPTPAPQPATITVSVSIDGSRAGYSSYMGGGTVTLAQGSSVYEALCATGAAVSGSRYYVSAINGLAEKQHGATSGWTYSVNGYFPSMACGNYILSGGETIRWIYSTDDNPTIKY